MTRKLVQILIAAAGVAFAQAASAQAGFSFNIDSIRAPISTKVVYAVKLQTLSTNATTGALVANANQVADLGVVDLIGKSVLLAELPGPKTAGSKTVVTGIRATFTVSGGIGWTIPAVPVTIATPATAVLSGQVLACRYDMPAQTAVMLPGQGAFLCVPGPAGSSASLPAPAASGPSVSGTITPAPDPTPAPTPAPAPTPVSTATASAPGSSICASGVSGCTVPALTQLVDKDGAVWTLPAAGQVLKDAINANPIYTDVNQLLVGSTGIVRIISPSHGYACLVAGTWVGAGC